MRSHLQTKIALRPCLSALGFGCVVLLVWVAMHSPAWARISAEQARRTLRDEHQLRLEDGVWIAPLEHKLRRRLKQLPHMHGRVQESEAKFQTDATLLVRNNAVLMLREQVLEADIQRRRELLNQRLTDGQTRLLLKQIEDQQQRLKLVQSQTIAPSALCQLPVVRQQLVEITNRRNDLAIALLWIHQQRPIISALYETLAANRQIQTALASLGDDARLGPAEDYNSDRILRLLRRFEEAVFTDVLPLYGQGEALRVAGLVGQTPVTFTWADSLDLPLIPATVVERSGLTIAEKAARQTITLESGRQVEARRFQIPYLRFGGHLLQDVDALALPPDAEEEGAKIGPRAFVGLRVSAEPERFRLAIRPDE